MKPLLTCVFVLLIFACSPTLQAQTFTAVTTGNIGADRTDTSGVSWVDFDGDGDLDVFLSNRNTSSYLYRNDGGTFTRVSRGSLTVRNSIGNCWADYDNDGDLDAFLAAAPSFLHRNNGTGNFTDVTSSAGVSGTFGWACAWADYDQDGFLDLIVTHPAGFVGNTPVPNLLYHNDGDGTFTKITDLPMTQELAPYTVATWSDFDLDGDADLFIGSGPADGTRARDYLYRNLLVESGSVAFERINTSPIGTDLVDGQVWNWIDYDNDGDLDAYMTNFWGGQPGGQPNNLYRNDDGTYVRVTNQALGTANALSLANVWGDFDNDGDLDVFVANDSNTGIANWYHRNNGNGTFTRITSGPIGTDALPSWGAAAGDYDDDGDLDLFVGNIARQTTTPNNLYRNDLSNDNHWLKINLTGTTSNRSGIGTTVRAKATINGNAVWQFRDVSSQNTFCGQNSLTVHFGFGDAATIDSLDIQWPSGIRDVLTNVTPDQTLAIEEGTHPIVSIEDQGAVHPTPFHWVPNYPNPFTNETQLTLQVTESQEVVVAVHNLLGQRVALLHRGWLQAQAAHRFSVYARDWPAGVYIVRASGQSFSATTRLIHHTP